MKPGIQEISDFILREVEGHPNDIVLFVATTFGISRQSAHYRVVKEVEKGNLIQTGRTKSTRYFRVGGKNLQFKLKLKGLGEDRIWTEYVKPMLARSTENVRRIADHGFKEMLNNAIDHSEGTDVWISVAFEDENLCIDIVDNGVGIFKKITTALSLPHEREAILHLSKGKFTTDPSKHSGEGIFFTSRMVDVFSILSDDLYYMFNGREWLLCPERPETSGKGTHIRMEIRVDTTKMPADAYAFFSDEKGFHKTRVAVSLSSDPSDPHNSRSQAKRLMVGLESFKSVVLDFKDINEVGQAFVDEVFRVFKIEHPHVEITYINANPEVDSVIRAGMANKVAGDSSS